MGNLLSMESKSYLGNNSLSPLVLHNIINQLPVEEVFWCRLISKEFKAAADTVLKNHDRFSKIKVSSKPKIDCFLDFILDHKDNIKQLKLTITNDYTNEDLHEILPELSDIKRPLYSHSCDGK